MPAPLLDLHAHFPMHTKFPPTFQQGNPPVGKQAEFMAANMLVNYWKGRPRVRLEDLLAGQPGAIGSVLYDPEDEFFQGVQPVPGAFDRLKAQLQNVEAEVAGRVRVVRNPADLEACVRSGERCLFHCIEGGFGFGGVAANVDEAAALGVAYVIPAHLFFRGVAGCENALPGVPDQLFRTLLNGEQGDDRGLTDPLGRDIVNLVYERGMIADITHSTQRAQREIFDIAADHGAPVISSHTGVRPASDYPLNLSLDAVQRIKESKGVIGVILADHWLRQPSEQVFGPSDKRLLFRAIDCIHDLTGSYDFIAIGTDLDGFIHPLKEYPSFAETRDLARDIEIKYGEAAAARILCENALRTLHAGWKGVSEAEAPAAAAPIAIDAAPTVSPVRVPFKTFRSRKLSLLQSCVADYVRRQGAPLAAPGLTFTPHADNWMQALVAAAEPFESLEAGEPAPPVPAGTPALLPAHLTPLDHCARAILQIAFGGKLEHAQGKEELAKFGTCDPGWLKCLQDYVGYLWKGHIQAYRPPSDDDDMTSVFEDLPDPCRIGIIGDWGTGTPEALEVLRQLRRDMDEGPGRPMILLHLGDIYYSGIASEVATFRNQCREVFPAEDIFTLAGNHDMYSGGGPYYDLISSLNRPAGRLQQRSYFCLRNQSWQLQAMDTGKNDSDPLALGTKMTSLDSREATWHQARLREAGERGVVLLSHHQPLSAFASVGKSFLKDKYVNDSLVSVFDVPAPGGAGTLLERAPLWLFGHEHNFAVYKPYGRLRGARCLGSSAVPASVADNPYHQKNDDIKWDESLKLSVNPATGLYTHSYAVMDLEGKKCTIRYFQYPEVDGRRQLGDGETFTSP